MILIFSVHTGWKYNGQNLEIELLEFKQNYFWDYIFFIFILFAIFILHSRESELYFARHICTHLGVAVFEVSGPPVFHIKMGLSAVPLNALPKDTTSELAGLFSTTSPKCRAPSREAVDIIF